jgi:glycogenin glucosyltransferase
LYDYIIRVESIGNPEPSKLSLMGRPDLAETFTKIALWRQTQFRKIVFIDADALCLRAPDELFDIDASFAAAPEAGWPDAFNSGVLVLEPSLAVFDFLLSMAKSAESFDGGDQGLLNIHFPGFHRLPFLYNVTTFKSYRLYVPALQHFHDDIAVIHFTGRPKPWQAMPDDGDAPHPYDEFRNWTLERWWEVHDKHVEKAGSG